MAMDDEIPGLEWGMHARGKPVELFIASYCMLASLVKLRVSTSFTDDEGVDIVFNSWGSTATLAIQVKARFTDSLEVQRGDFIADVARSTFQPRPSYHVLFVVVDPGEVHLGPLWVVPSELL